jgi:hypothetical protein
MFKIVLRIGTCDGETVSAPPILTVIPRKAVKDEQFSKVIKY